MFFKRSKGEFRETERITRFKLIKSGKTWMRASISQLGFFRISRGDATDKIVRPFETFADPVPAPISKGILVLGALAGATTIATPVLAEENEVSSFLESEIIPTTGVVGQDSFVLGTTSATDSGSMNRSVSESLSHTESGRQSVSKSSSLSQSVSLSESYVTSGSVSHVDSLLASEQDPEISEKVNKNQTTRSEEDVKRLQALALDLYTYRAQALEIPGTEAAIESGDLSLEAIRSGLSNPAIQIEAVESQAKSARNRLANAVLRATSGQRDPRTGDSLDAENRFRAPFFMSGPANNYLITAYNSDPVKLQYIVRERSGGVILTYMGYAPNSERVEGVLVPNATLKSPFAPM